MKSACPHFGLLLGIRSGPAAAGIAGHLFRHAESVHAALRLFIAHLHLHDRGGVVALGSHGAEDVELSYLIHHPNTPDTAQILDASIAIACSVMRCLCGAQWTPSEVTLSRGRPRALGPYRSFFRAPIRFDAPRSAYAEVLGIKPRRLRERLEAEGSSVKELLEDLRCEPARQLLEESRLPIGEIAATLHYSKPGAFSRACKGWSGKTPQAWRKAVGRRARAAKADGGPLSRG